MIEILECKHCKKTIKDLGYWLYNYRFCSDKCAVNWQRKRLAEISRLG